MACAGWQLDSDPKLPLGAKRAVRRSVTGPGVRIAAAVLLPVVAALWWLGPAHAKRPHDTSENVPVQSDVSAFEENVIRYANAERTQRGMLPLEVTSGLTFVARRHSDNMCRTRIFEHESEAFPDGWQDFADRLKKAGLMSGGENIAYRTITRDPERWAREVVHGWMNSPRHKRNILHPSFRYTGVGIRLCGNRLGYATQVFSKHRGRLAGDGGDLPSVSVRARKGPVAQLIESRSVAPGRSHHYSLRQAAEPAVALSSVNVFKAALAPFAQGRE